MRHQTKANLTTAEIIAGALEIFEGGKRWNNTSLQETNDAGIETYCALGALSMVAMGKVGYPEHSSATPAYKKAADLVASFVPRRYHLSWGDDIPEWNDSLSEASGFRSVEQVFCKALKAALSKERSAGRKVPRRRKS